MKRKFTKDDGVNFDCREYESHCGQIIGDRLMRAIAKLGKTWSEIPENSTMHKLKLILVCINNTCVYILFSVLNFSATNDSVNSKFYFSVMLIM